MITASLPLAVTSILAVVSPLLAALFQHVKMNSIAKNNVALGVSFLISGYYVLSTSGPIHWANLEGVLTTMVGLLPVLYLIQQTIYHTLLKSTAAKITIATSALVSGVAKSVDAQAEAGVTVTPVVATIAETDVASSPGDLADTETPAMG